MAELALFPLRAVLLPGGRMPLQIFEPRYVDLVGRSMRNDAGFGIVRITEGHEVVIAQGATPPATAPVGTLARIVDWDALQGGRLCITVEGSQRFRVLSTRVANDHLVSAEVEWLEDSPPAPLAEAYSHLHEIMGGLSEHPALRRLGVDAATLDSRTLAYALAQYLPLDEDDRYRVLLEPDALAALELIDGIVKRFSA